MASPCRLHSSFNNPPPTGSSSFGCSGKTRPSTPRSGAEGSQSLGGLRASDPPRGFDARKDGRLSSSMDTIKVRHFPRGESLKDFLDVVTLVYEGDRHLPAPR